MASTKKERGSCLHPHQEKCKRSLAVKNDEGKVKNKKKGRGKEKEGENSCCRKIWEA